MIVSQDEILTELGFDPELITDIDLDTINSWHKKAERLVKTFVGYNIEQATYTEFLPDTTARRSDDPIIVSYELVNGRVTPYTVDVTANQGLFLQLTQIPVRSITSIYENPGAWLDGGATPVFPSGTLLPVSAYILDYTKSDLSETGSVYRQGGYWTYYPRAVKITYVAGYTAAELDDQFSDFKAAVLCAVNNWFNAIMARRFNQRTGAIGGVLVREKLGDWQVDYEPVAQRRAIGYSSLPRDAMVILEPYIRIGKYLPFG